MAKANERDRYKYGVCTNRDYKDGKPCPKCVSKEVQPIRTGQDFVCEECKEPMRQVPPPKPPFPTKMVIIIAAVVVIGIAAVVVFIGGYFTTSKSEVKVEATTITLVSSLSLDKPSLPLKVNESATFTLSVQPDNATDKSVEWSSSDATIAVVDENGKVTAVKEGAAVITVKTKDRSNLSVTSTVNVLPAEGGGNGGNPPTPSTSTPTFPCGKYSGDLSNGKPHGLGTFTYSKRTLIDDHKMVYAEQNDYITGTFREGKIISVKLFDSGGNLKQTVIPQQPASICR